MPNNRNVEKDYEEADQVIRKMVEEELKRIKEKAAQIEKEAEKTGEDLELSMKENETKNSGKKG